MSHFSFLPLNAGFPEILRSSPERFQPVVELVANLMAEEASRLTVGERELIVAYVAGKNRCEFCVGFHGAAAEGAGFDREQLEEMVVTDDYSGLDKALVPCLVLARKITLEPSRVTQADIDGVVEFWDEQVAQDVIALSSLMNFANRMVSAYGVIGSEDTFSAVLNSARQGERLYGR